MGLHTFRIGGVKYKQEVKDFKYGKDEVCRVAREFLTNLLATELAMSFDHNNKECQNPYVVVEKDDSVQSDIYYKIIFFVTPFSESGKRLDWIEKSGFDYKANGWEKLDGRPGQRPCLYKQFER